MRLLLDTHVFLWWDQGAATLADAARTAIARPENDIFISAASVWEIAIKRRLGKLLFRGSAAAAIGLNGFRALPVDPDDTESAGALVWDHSDPFDRLLVAQAIRHDLTFVTADRIVRGFGGVAQLWAG